jgi:hypothetical protein
MSAPTTRVITSQTITRPADTTAYAAGDLVANNTTAGSVTPFLFSNVVRQLGYKNKIVRAAAKLSGTAITNGSFRLHLFSAAPTVTNGDNAAIVVATNITAYLGYLDIVQILGGASGNMGWSVAAWGAPPTMISASSKSLWGLLEAKAAYVPASGETIILSIEVE